MAWSVLSEILFWGNSNFFLVFLFFCLFVTLGCIVFALILLVFGFFVSFSALFRVFQRVLGCFFRPLGLVECKSFYEVGSKLCVHRKYRRVPIPDKGK
jgi:hypothetical protein